jgi:hypothetical protein
MPKTKLPALPAHKGKCHTYTHQHQGANSCALQCALGAWQATGRVAVVVHGRTPGQNKPKVKVVRKRGRKKGVGAYRPVKPTRQAPTNWPIGCVTVAKPGRSKRHAPWAHHTQAGPIAGQPNLHTFSWLYIGVPYYAATARQLIQYLTSYYAATQGTPAQRRAKAKAQLLGAK